MGSILPSSQARREAWAEDLLDRLTPAMSALGVLFLLVVLSEQFARLGSGVGAFLTIVGWGCGRFSPSSSWLGWWWLRAPAVS